MKAIVWPSKVTGERRVMTFDFTDELQPTETVIGASISVVLLGGTDATPAALLDGAQQVATPLVMQAVHAGVAGCNYGVLCLATTSTGNVLAAAGVLPVREPW